jgi:hypothetical protein
MRHTPWSDLKCHCGHAPDTPTPTGRTVCVHFSKEAGDAKYRSRSLRISVLRGVKLPTHGVHSSTWLKKWPYF